MHVTLESEDRINIIYHIIYSVIYNISTTCRNVILNMFTDIEYAIC